MTISNDDLDSFVVSARPRGARDAIKSHASDLQPSRVARPYPTIPTTTSYLPTLVTIEHLSSLSATILEVRSHFFFENYSDGWLLDFESGV